MIVYVLISMLALTICLNFILVYLLLSARKKAKAKQPDATAQEMLSQLLSGPAVFRIEVIDKGSLIQWRPQ